MPQHNIPLLHPPDKKKMEWTKEYLEELWTNDRPADDPETALFLISSWRTSKLIPGTPEVYNSSVEQLSLLLTLVPLLLPLLSLLLLLSLALLSLEEETKISTNVNSKKTYKQGGDYT